MNNLDCPYCQGKGIYYKPVDIDEYEPEECPVCEIEKRNKASEDNEAKPETPVCNTSRF